MSSRRVMLLCGLVASLVVAVATSVSGMEFQFRYGVSLTPASNGITSWPAVANDYGFSLYDNWLAISADYGAVRFPHIRMMVGYTNLLLSDPVRLRIAGTAGPALGYYDEELYPMVAASLLVSIGPPAPRFGWNFYVESYGTYSFRSDSLPLGYDRFLVAVSTGIAIRW